MKNERMKELTALTDLTVINVVAILNLASASNQRAHHMKKDRSTEVSLEAGNDDYSVLLIEDHPMLFEGFSETIQQILPEAKLQVVNCGLAAESLFEKCTFDLVFLDLNLPDINGFDLLERMRKNHFAQPAVILTAAVSTLVLEKAKRLGALGVFSKRVDRKHLKKTCVKSKSKIARFPGYIFDQGS